MRTLQPGKVPVKRFPTGYSLVTSKGKNNWKLKIFSTKGLMISCKFIAQVGAYAKYQICEISKMRKLLPDNNLRVSIKHKGPIFLIFSQSIFLLFGKKIAEMLAACSSPYCIVFEVRMNVYHSSTVLLKLENKERAITRDGHPGNRHHKYKWSYRIPLHLYSVNILTVIY